jgi:hypothetical protein
MEHTFRARRRSPWCSVWLSKYHALMLGCSIESYGFPDSLRMRFNQRNPFHRDRPEQHHWTKILDSGSPAHEIEAFSELSKIHFHIYWFAPISSDLAGPCTFGSDMRKRNDQFFLVFIPSNVDLRGWLFDRGWEVQTAPIKTINISANVELRWNFFNYISGKEQIPITVQDRFFIVPRRSHPSNTWSFWSDSAKVTRYPHLTQISWTSLGFT